MSEPIKHDQSDEKQPGSANKSGAGQWAKYSEIAFIIPSAVIGGYILGALASHFLGWGWAPLAGIIFGSVAGFYQMIRIVMKATKE